MTHLGTIASGLLVFAALPAGAGGIERTQQSVGILFTEGRYAELSFGHLAPSVSGGIPGTPYTTGGGVLADASQYGLAVKLPVTPEIDMALVIDQPVGADVGYPTGALYPIAGTTANLDAVAVTLMGRYRLPTNISLIGGIRALRNSGEVNLPVTLPTGQTIPYTMESSTETDWGYLIGIAYERPDIALRVSLTYNSAIEHHFAAREETVDFTGQLVDQRTAFSTTIPQSLHLEAQTGIAEDLLLFGSVRWVDWSAFDIDPTAYRTNNIANPGQTKLVGYDEDYTTWTLGLGRRFSDTWSAAVATSFEDSAGAQASNLGPVNGFSSLGVIVVYDAGPVEITGQVHYVALTSTETQQINARFDGNHMWLAGLKLGYRF